MHEYVNIHGQPVLTNSTPKQLPKKKAEAPEEWHKGWRVEGFAPGRIETAKKLADDAVARWAAMSEQERSVALRDGRREPKPWDEEAFVSASKPTPVRAKPYAVHSSAEQCAEMARKSGWLHVSVVEMAKRKQ